MLFGSRFLELRCSLAVVGVGRLLEASTTLGEKSNQIETSWEQGIRVTSGTVYIFLQTNINGITHLYISLASVDQNSLAFGEQHYQKDYVHNIQDCLFIFSTRKCFITFSCCSLSF